MQTIKDSFLLTLRERMEIVAPLRRVEISGIERPAIVALENELPAPELLPDVCYLEWGGGRELPGTTLNSVECELTFVTRGSEENNGADRGRRITEFRRDLLLCLEPAQAALKLYALDPPFDTGARLIWRILPSEQRARNGAVSFTMRLDVLYPRAQETA